MSTQPTTVERARWAGEAVVIHGCARGDSPGAAYEDETADLLCSLMHLSRLRGMDFEELLRCARANYEADILQEFI